MGQIRPSGNRSANAKANKYTMRADTSIKLAVDRTKEVHEQCLANSMNNNNCANVKGQFRKMLYFYTTVLHPQSHICEHFTSLRRSALLHPFQWLDWVGNPTCHPASAPPPLAGISALRGEYMFDIDASNFGNFTRFMNHECYSDKVGIQLLFGNRKGTQRSQIVSCLGFDRKSVFSYELA